MRRSDHHDEQTPSQPPAAAPQPPDAAGNAAGDLFSELFENLDRRQKDRRAWDRRQTPPPPVDAHAEEQMAADSRHGAPPLPPQAPPHQSPPLQSSPPQTAQASRGLQPAAEMPTATDWQRFTPRPP